MTNSERKAKFQKSMFVGGIALNFEPINNLIGRDERSAFAFDFFPKGNDYPKLIRIFVPNDLRKRCINELQNFDNVEVKILKLEGNFDRFAYKLLDFNFIKRPEKNEKYYSHMSYLCEKIKSQNEHRHDYICKFVQITYSKPQELRTAYAKPITVIFDKCLWAQDYIYYIDEITDKLRRIKVDNQVKIKHSYPIDEVSDVDPRLMVKYQEIKALIKSKR